MPCWLPNTTEGDHAFSQPSPRALLIGIVSFSSGATGPRRRQVLQIEGGHGPLPSGLYSVFREQHDGAVRRVHLRRMRRERKQLYHSDGLPSGGGGVVRCWSLRRERGRHLCWRRCWAECARRPGLRLLRPALVSLDGNLSLSLPAIVSLDRYCRCWRRQ